jgi:S-adenosylmethionine decarboxylase
MAAGGEDSFKFEGPEKKLVIDFIEPIEDPSNKGMLNVTEEQWASMLKCAGCKILSSKCTENMNAYILSESSLFVYRFQVTIKTCGTTTILNCLPRILYYASIQSLTVMFVTYCRKNFMFPTMQPSPHDNFDHEVKILKDNLAKRGDAYILGPTTGEHWHLFVADFTDIDPIYEHKQNVEIMMVNLDTTVMDVFYRSRGLSAKQITTKLGLDKLLPGTLTDEFLFDPCGFSLNGVVKEKYWYTIHVTPEHTHSYVSFETNIEVLTSFNELISKVVEIFKPGDFSIAIFTDYAALASSSHSLTSYPHNYRRLHKTTQEFEGDYSVTLANFTRDFVCSESHD